MLFLFIQFIFNLLARTKQANTKSCKLFKIILQILHGDEREKEKGKERDNIPNDMANTKFRI